jgi:nucleoside-diphosphate-sugar epimerase
MRILVFGYGYVAKHLINMLDKDHKIYCTSRSVQIDSVIIEKNTSLINFHNPFLNKIISDADVILSTIPPNKDQIDPTLLYYKESLNNSSCDWLGYISATSVYGNHNGNWVTENSICSPSNELSKKRLAAEKQWQNLINTKPHIFRVAGIYGPGRNCLERILQGQKNSIVKKNQFFSRIHVHDLCKSILKSIQTPTPGETFNVSDNLPTSNTEVEQFAANLLNLQPLVEVDYNKSDITDSRKRFFKDNKKICNNKIKSMLALEWKYPNYKIGLEKGCLPFIN